MKLFSLNEDKLPPRLPVIYSDYITSQIEDICDSNRGNANGLSELKKFIKRVANHVSNRAIAFCYGNNCSMPSNGTVYIYDMGAVFCLKDDLEKVFIEITWIDLNLKDFGLNENRHIDNIITEIINQYLRRNLLLAS